ncbi:hypothetical protein BASA50_003462 [Batrachochytrium salamandrivorans]|uniref:PB1 domain-containing protein n=1 Tax=Batrachochytrium salamandrivorans TaxID=1357716 RepID=A0ABQ8FIQ9_9FUNG|nr:hypothetical protein BASA60_007555 [Batrachochytrium salamandrivorans]KAH6575361.1 hypothetical protein BASA62_001973 [Batrachochytrium salamandrivorans]KAH6584691.1 hypothetical protein BASA60_000874 [Batrachochytrium salamandrivorans]KAH6598347.1 hypothetical protein BASA61_002884 [Batrachochytrium salamandrivorans]KAH6598955.1 hypothetical protein BASA50_003462 [Batrachochytrium salamandrivorans]
MALKEQLAQWSKALDFWDQQDFASAYEQFVSFADFAKIHYNVGMCAMRINNLEIAVAAFGRAIAADEYLSIAYVQRGICLYHMGDIDGALANFEESFKMLRGNFFIDYTQLGMPFQVYACHAIFNIALCHFQRGDTERGVRYISEALRAVTKESEFTPDITDIEEAAKLGERAADMAMPYEVPPTLVFRPQEDNLKNAERVDYLGQSRVVASVNATDNYTGFSGKLTRDLTLLSRPKKDLDNVAAKQLALKSPSAMSTAQTTLVQSNIATMSRNGSIGGLRRDNYPDSSGQVDTLGRSGTIARGLIPRRSSSANTSIGTLSGLTIRSPGSISRAATSASQSDTYHPPLSSRSQLTATPPRTSPAYGDTDPFDVAAERFNKMTININNNNNRDIQDPPVHIPIRRGSNTSISSSVAVGSDTIKVKCHYTESRFILVPTNIPFRELRERISNKFSAQGLLSLKYKDEDGYMTMMINDDDLDDAVSVSGVGRLELWCFLLDAV